MKTIFKSICILALFAVVVFPTQASAQVPPRFYWKSLVGGNALPLIYMDLSGNANPFDASDFVIPDSTIDASIALVANHAIRCLHSCNSDTTRIEHANPHRGLSIICGHKPLLNSERTNARENVAAVLTITDIGLVHHHLQEQVINVDICGIRPRDDGYLAR